MTREEDEDNTTTTTTISENITTITPTDAPTTIITTTEVQNSTTITNIEPDESDDTVLIASLTAVGAVILILCIALSVFMYIRGKRRKIVGRYNPAYLEDRQAAERQERHKMPYVIPLPPRERLI